MTAELLLTPAEARILGCLIEKKELTPDVYPMTSNALLAAANQKTSRDPVMSLDQGEIARALGSLQSKGLVRQQFASRVERYEHLMAQKLSLTRNQSALIGLLLLRGPQTVHELLARAERIANLPDAEAVRGELDMLIGRRPPLVVEIERGAGQREERYGHLLSGAPAPMPALAQTPVRTGDTEARIAALEARVAALEAAFAKLLERS